MCAAVVHPNEVTGRQVFSEKSLSKKEEQARIVVLAGELALLAHRDDDECRMSKPGVGVRWFC
jgi:hypothetical protein